MGENPNLGSNAGYDIIKAETYDKNHRGCEYQIVLGRNPKTGTYVTWECNAHSDGDRDYYWGHYINKWEAALADYHRRLLEHFERIEKTGGGVRPF